MNWPITKLDKVADAIDYGHTAPSTTQQVGPKYLRITDIQENRVDWEAVPFCECSSVEQERYALSRGDIVFARTGATTGKSYLIRDCPDGAVFASYLIRVRPSKAVDSGYLAHFFDTPFYWQQITKSATGSTQPGVNSTKLKELDVPLPPLSEQKRIAGILDQADGLRRKRQQALALTDQFLRSTFLDLFGDHVEGIESWDRCFLSDVLFFQEGPGVRKWQFTESGVKLLNVGNIVDGELVLDNTVRHVSELEAFGKYKHFLAEPGDLVMATSGVTWGKTAWVAENHLPLCMNTSTVRFRTLDENRVSRVYMHAFLGSDPFTRQIDKLVTGSAQPNFGPSHLKQVEIVVPPIERQLRYGKIVARLNQTVSSVKQAVSECDALFNSLVQRAFRGDL